MYGTAQGVAYYLKELSESHGIDTEIHEMDSLKVSDLSNIKYLAVVSSTTGSGDVPANGENFWHDLQNTSINLSSLNFGVCALGDITYENFCGAGKSISKRLIDRGATPLCNIGELDGGDDGSEEWCKNFLSTLKDE